MPEQFIFAPHMIAPELMAAIRNPAHPQHHIAIGTLLGLLLPALPEAAQDALLLSLNPANVVVWANVVKMMLQIVAEYKAQQQQNAPVPAPQPVPPPAPQPQPV
jgi:hypothetical protein